MGFVDTRTFTNLTATTAATTDVGYDDDDDRHQHRAHRGNDEYDYYYRHVDDHYDDCLGLRGPLWHCDGGFIAPVGLHDHVVETPL